MTITNIETSVRQCIVSRGLAATVEVAPPFVRLSRKVRDGSGLTETISSAFRFDGDLVLLRGLSKAAAALEGKINQAEHMGLQVL